MFKTPLDGQTFAITPASSNPRISYGLTPDGLRDSRFRDFCCFLTDFRLQALRRLPAFEWEERCFGENDFGIDQKPRQRIRAAAYAWLFAHADRFGYTFGSAP